MIADDSEDSEQVQVKSLFWNQIWPNSSLFWGRMVHAFYNGLNDWTQWNRQSERKQPIKQLTEISGRKHCFSHLELKKCKSFGREKPSWKGKKNLQKLGYYGKCSFDVCKFTISRPGFGDFMCRPAPPLGETGLKWHHDEPWNVLNLIRLPGSSLREQENTPRFNSVITHDGSVCMPF